MRILHVVESLDVGGAERLVLQLARSQVRAGDAVTIGCLFREGPLADAARSDGIAIHNAGKRPGADPQALARLRAWLGAPPDVVHTHGPMTHYYTVAVDVLQALAGGPRPLIVNTRHGQGTGASRRLRWLYRLAIGRTRIAVAVSRAAATRLVADGWLRDAWVTTIPNGIGLEAVAARSAEAKAALLAALGVDGDPTVIGSVGRLVPAKGHDVLLRAFARLRQRRPQASLLVIVGAGSERAALERTCAALGLTGAVRWLGERTDVGQLLAAFDAFVLPSRSEGWSLALMEAMAAGLPIIANDVGGNAEVLDGGRFGRLTTGDDAHAWAAALAELLDEPGAGARRGDAARQWALRHGGIDTTRRRYAALYADALAARGRTPERLA